MNLYEGIKNNLNEAKVKKPKPPLKVETKLRRAGFSRFYFDDWLDYNYDELERRFEDFKNSDDENAKIYGFADFAVDLMLQTGGKDIRRKKTQEEKEYEKELKSLGIDKDEFENWLALFEDKAYPDFKGDADKDNDAYMKYLYDLYLNHADKYMDPEDLD